MKDEKTQKTKNIIVLSFLAFYLLIALILLIFITPDAIYAIRRYFEFYLNRNTLALLFIFLVLLSFSIIITFVVFFVRHRDNFPKEPMQQHDDSPTAIGDYSNERRYLEKQIEELTNRLTNTEDKWAAINHLILAGNTSNLAKGTDPSSKAFLSGLGIDLSSISIEKKMIFVLTPSDREYHKDFVAVREVCHDCRLNAIRGDDVDLNYGSRNMLAYIVEHILSARVIIANISNRNPNVFYEIGIAHMAGKPTVLLCRENEKVPFDLQQKFIIFYSSEEDLAAKLKNELISIIANDE